MTTPMTSDSRQEKQKSKRQEEMLLRLDAYQKKEI